MLKMKIIKEKNPKNILVLIKNRHSALDAVSPEIVLLFSEEDAVSSTARQ